MKFTYRTDTYTDDAGEIFLAIYCAELGELAIETKGDIVCTENDDLADVLADTPWAGNKDTKFADEWSPLTDMESIGSAGLREWIAAKEDVRYRVRPEFVDGWFGKGADPDDATVDLAEIERLAREWDRPVAELMCEVEEA